MKKRNVLIIAVVAVLIIAVVAWLFLSGPLSGKAAHEPAKAPAVLQHHVARYDYDATGALVLRADTAKIDKTADFTVETTIKLSDDTYEDMPAFECVGVATWNTDTKSEGTDYIGMTWGANTKIVPDSQKAYVYYADTVSGSNDFDYDSAKLISADDTGVQYAVEARENANKQLLVVAATVYAEAPEGDVWAGTAYEREEAKMAEQLVAIATDMSAK